MRRKDCTHSEPSLNKGGQLVDFHDCDYVDARNKLIPEAEKLADRLLRQRDRTQDRHSNLWTRYFIEAMDELWSRNKGN